MHSWELVLRNGFLPQWTKEQVEPLRKALLEDAPELKQGATTVPPPLMCVQDWPCEASDAIAYIGWKGFGVETVGEVEEYFARFCFEADRKLGEPAACRWFLNWYDDTPRDQMRKELLRVLGGYYG